MTPALETRRLRLTPLQESDSAEMVSVLADHGLYEFIGGTPPTLDELETRYQALVAGSPAADETWHNWIIRLAKSGEPVGYVQATVAKAGTQIAWLVGVEWQGRGIATEAADAMTKWLGANGTQRLLAHIQPDHAASAKVAAALGLLPTGAIDADGESIWERLSEG